MVTFRSKVTATRLEVFTAVKIQVKVFWVVVPHSVVVAHKLKMQAAQSSTVLVSCHITTWLHNSENLDLEVPGRFQISRNW
jgi:BarA-like signal transduction histidine kinase